MIAEDVGGRIESAAAERAAQLIADASLDRFEGGREQFSAARAVLVARRQARTARRLRQVQHDRFGWIGLALVAAEAHREIQAHRGVPHPRSRDALDAQLLKGLPRSDEHVRVDERHLDGVLERRLLRGGQLGTQVRNASSASTPGSTERALTVLSALRAVGQVRHFDAPAGAFGPDVPHAHHRAAHPDSHRRSGGVEPGVVGPRRHDVVHRRSGERGRHERSHEEPRDRRIAVREMEVVALRFLAANRVEVLARAGS